MLLLRWHYEMISRLLIGLFIETPSQVLEDVAHRDIGNAFEMKIDIGDSPDDFFFEFEFFQDAVRPRGKPGYEILQVRIDMIGVGQDDFKRQTAFVEKTEPSFLKDDFFDAFVAHALVGRLTF